MEFRTQIAVKKASQSILHQSRILMLGSCFTENIGERLYASGFNVDVNPFGIQYNPLSIAAALNLLLNKRDFTVNDLFQHEGSWHSFMHHSRFSGNSAQETLQNINTRLQASSDFLNKSDYLIITLGTAWIYELKENGQIVSNCHKLPESTFNRRRISVEDIVNTYTPILQIFKSSNLQIIFTVSPIRHWKDGAHENNLSKSVLLLAIDELQRQFDSVSYFPAYELLLDDLRDYRFYTEDMLHPNSTAINYIWEKFSDCYFSDKTKQIASEVEKLNRMKQHRPFNTEGEEYRKFCEVLEKKKIEIKNFYPEINV
jgi:lysophospholipase L1-like esterase